MAELVSKPGARLLHPKAQTFGPGLALVSSCPFQGPAHSPSVFKPWVLPTSHPGHHLPPVTLTSPGYGLFML